MFKNLNFQFQPRRIFKQLFTPCNFLKSIAFKSVTNRMQFQMTRVLFQNDFLSFLLKSFSVIQKQNFSTKYSSQVIDATLRHKSIINLFQSTLISGSQLPGNIRFSTRRGEKKNFHYSWEIYQENSKEKISANHQLWKYFFIKNTKMNFF